MARNFRCFLYSYIFVNTYQIKVVQFLGGKRVMEITHDLVS